MGIFMHILEIHSKIFEDLYFSSYMRFPTALKKISYTAAVVKPKNKTSSCVYRRTKGHG